MAGYNVYRSAISGGPYTRLNTSTVSLLSYTDPTVLASQLYYYTVTSVMSDGVESVYATPVSATIPTP
jgi:fibronectin type 3 domain-containing protein